jgi:hypothetical protein
MAMGEAHANGGKARGCAPREPSRQVTRRCGSVAATAAIVRGDVGRM